jgi:hypothetical protein
MRSAAPRPAPVPDRSAFDAPLGHRGQLCGLTLQTHNLIRGLQGAPDRGTGALRPVICPSQCSGDARRGPEAEDNRQKRPLPDGSCAPWCVKRLPIGLRKTCCARPSLETPRSRRESTNRRRVNRQQARETLASTLPVLTPSVEGARSHRGLARPATGALSARR